MVSRFDRAFTRNEVVVAAVLFILSEVGKSMTLGETLRIMAANHADFNEALVNGGLRALLALARDPRKDVDVADTFAGEFDKRGMLSVHTYSDARRALAINDAGRNFLVRCEADGMDFSRQRKVLALYKKANRS